ncbi:MAG TPA: sugar phosphate isomerase/epimerase family protein [Phycisphaerae bacterium]|nr:sugar phosphate isomerase/epimerase family protein [Phycisphaerae bacterium]
MPILSAFADEISQDPREQMDALEDNDIRFIELRGVWGVNVMRLTDAQCSELKKQLDDRGFGISCIASPIGKIRLDEDYRKHFDQFRRVVDLAEIFDSRYIRIFSYYPPEGEAIAPYRREVIDRINEKVDYVSHRNVTLVLENEKHLFGAVPERCVYLLAAVRSRKLVAAFDPANFVNMDVRDVYHTCWIPLRSFVGYFHIKDFKYGEEERAVPAGQGDGDIPQILRDAASDGYNGFLALEPHLAKAEHSSGQTGPRLFKVAADALKAICREINWPL